VKRIISGILCLALLLTGCTQAAPTPVLELSANEIANAVAESQTEGSGLNILAEDVLEGYLQSLGLEGWEDAAVLTGEGMDAREITVLLLPDEKAAAEAARLLEEHRQARIVDFFGYAPEQVELLENARAVVQGNCAAFLACEDMERATEVFGACFEGKDGTIVEPLPSPEPSAAVEVNPGLDTSGFPPYEQPNDVDMTLYDNTAVVDAWKTGKENGLSEKDQTILAACREVFAEVISEDMTDFEKELALHDWLVKHGQYDAKSRDNVAHIGQPDNNNPYGMLTGGYGICLGFATTFQLFMDLAEIECITVVGAAYGSGQDHAWNMVKLDGEWYCVDVTWNNSGDSGNNVLQRQKATHRYFNVTSERLRETDHQWEYESIPEATAEHYRWEGVGKLPA